jgi:hypothetical protein
MILTDGLHVVSDTSIAELHEFAQRAGLKRCWYQGNPRHPHYDTLSARTRTAALEAGAVRVSSNQIALASARLSGRKVGQGRPVGRLSRQPRVRRGRGVVVQRTQKAVERSSDASTGNERPAEVRQPEETGAPTMREPGGLSD